MKRTSFYRYCYLAETKNLLISCVLFCFFCHPKQISNVKTTETKIHPAACHTLDNIWTFLTSVYQQCEKKYWQKTKGFALMLVSNCFINKYVYITKSQFLFVTGMLKMKPV